MNKIKFVIAAAALLGTSALQSCSKKESVAPTPNQTVTKSNSSLIKEPGSIVIVTSSSGNWQYPDDPAADAYCAPGGECYDITIVSGLESKLKTIGSPSLSHYEVFTTDGTTFNVNPKDGSGSSIPITHLIQDKDVNGVLHLNLMP